MNPELRRDLMAALERPHRLGTIGGDLEEQLAHCASFSSVLAEVLGERSPTRGCDLGTGGGLPGVALAALWPDMHWTLVDMRTARADEVERVVLRLGLHERTDVVGQQAQYLGHDDSYREGFDVVVARAFGPSSITAECAAGLTMVGGIFVVSEPPAAADDPERWDSEGVMALGFSDVRYLQAEDSRFAVFEKLASTPASIPRLPPRANRGWLKRPEGPAS